MCANMNLNIKDKTESLNRRRKIGPMIDKKTENSMTFATWQLFLRQFFEILFEFMIFIYRTVFLSMSQLSAQTY